jgi:hypothetical protein
MSDKILATSYGRLLVEFERTLSSGWDWPSPDSAFVAYVYHRVGEQAPCIAMNKLTWPVDTRLVHAPALAAAGFLLHAGGGEHLKDGWCAGVSRFQASNLFVDRQSFPYRPIELLGIVAGVAALDGNSAELVAWAKTLLGRTKEIHGYRGWAGLLQASGEFIIGIRNSQPAFDADDSACDELALSSWMSRVFEGAAPPTLVDKAFLTISATTTFDNLDLARAGLLHWSLRDVVGRVIESQLAQHWQLNRMRRDGEALVVLLCRRFHLFAEQFRIRHGGRTTVEIRDEYDVQDLMHAILALHFEDVRAEEVTPSVGGKTGRMDFLLKREQLVVETKMTRKNLDQKKVGDELMVDMTRYRSHPEYRTLVCFVYDPEGLCHNPTALEDDLTKTDGEYRTVVVVCPKGM